MNIQPLVDAVKELQSELDLNIVVYEDVVWSYDYDVLSVNTAGNADDLWNVAGQTYCLDVRNSVESEDGYVVFCDADNGCGTRDTVIVSANERVMWE